MNLKYYLRGLGIGIIVTAIIMLVLSAQNTKTLTDEEIKQKAKALGMVEQGGTLSELSLPDVDEDSAENAEKSTMDENVPENLSDDSYEDNGETSDEGFSGDEDEPDMSSSGNIDYNEVEKQIDEADAQLEEIKNGTVSSPSEEETEPTLKPTPEATPKPTPEPTPEPVKETKSSSGKGISFEINKGESSYAVAKNLKAAGFIEDAAEFDTYLCSTGLDRKICAGTFTIPEGSSEEEIARIIAK